MSVRITFETSVTGYFKGLKTELKSFLKSRGVGCFILTAYLPDENETRITHFLMEGESATLFVVKEALDTHLRHIYQDILLGEWVEHESTTPLTHTLLVPTAGCKSITSSGYAEIPEGKPKSPPEWKYIVASGFNTVVGYLRDVGYAVAVTQSAVSGLPKAISVTYKGVTAVVNVAYCGTWMNFVALLKDDKNLTVEKDKAIERVYYLDASEKTFVSDIELLKEGVRYYVELKVDKKGVVVDIDGFYKKLKSDEDLDDDDIEIIKNSFAAQKLKFKQLTGTEELAMTDEKLEDKIGIKSFGIRTAILSVIKNLKKD